MNRKYLKMLALTVGWSLKLPFGTNETVYSSMRVVTIRLIVGLVSLILLVKTIN